MGGGGGGGRGGDKTRRAKAGRREVTRADLYSSPRTASLGHTLNSQPLPSVCVCVCVCVCGCVCVSVCAVWSTLLSPCGLVETHAHSVNPVVVRPVHRNTTHFVSY